MSLYALSLLFLSFTIVSESFYIYSDPTRDELRHDLDELKREAQVVINGLAKAGKQALGRDLERLQTRVESLVRQLDGLDPQTDIGQRLLTKLETLTINVKLEVGGEIERLENELRYENVDKTRDELKKALDELRAQALKVLDGLARQGNGWLGKELERLDGQVVRIETQLETIDPKTEVGKALLHELEVVAKDVEEALRVEIRRLTPPGAQKDDVVDKLKKDLDKLIAESQVVC